MKQLKPLMFPWVVCIVEQRMLLSKSFFYKVKILTLPWETMTVYLYNYSQTKLNWFLFFSINTNVQQV